MLGIDNKERKESKDLLFELYHELDETERFRNYINIEERKKEKAFKNLKTIESSKGIEDKKKEKARIMRIKHLEKSLKLDRSTKDKGLSLEKQ